MKTITMWQPWASFVSLKWKTIETRTHSRLKSLEGQTIAIHAGIYFDETWYHYAKYYIDDKQLELVRSLKSIKGSIICTAFVKEHRLLNTFDSKPAMIDCGAKTRYGLILENVKAIKGKQGIWNFP